jgi:hypothetical protein
MLPTNFILHFGDTNVKNINDINVVFRMFYFTIPGKQGHKSMRYPKLNQRDDGALSDPTPICYPERLYNILWQIFGFPYAQLLLSCLFKKPYKLVTKFGWQHE